MSKQVNYNENLCSGAAIRDDKGRRISKLFEASHPKMTVGYAKNLIMPDTPTEQEFNFRQSGGGVIEDGVAVIDKVKGNSVVWNQISKQNINASVYTYSQAQGKITISSVPSDFNNDAFIIFNLIAEHKYAIKTTSNKDYFRLGNYFSLGLTINAKDGVIYSYHTNWGIVLGYTESAEIGTHDLRIQVTDLTQMFGAGNEPTTYAEFLSRKPKVADEYAYNEGAIVDNKVEKVKATGVNLWDEEWELGSYSRTTGEKTSDGKSIRCKNLIPIESPSLYCISSAEIIPIYYDANKSVIGSNPNGWQNRIEQVPSGTKYITFYAVDSYGTTYNHDICINVSDPAINGQYFPYEKHELDLSWVKDIKDGEGVKLFEDGMKSAGTACDEVRKDKAVKRIRKYVFDGSEPITEIKLNDDGTAFKVVYNALFETTSTGTYNAVSIGAGFYSKYNGGYYFDLWAAGFASVRAYIICVPSSVAKTKDEIKEYLKQKYNEGNPLVVYYELAEPIEVEYDEKNLTYPVIAGGTEEAIASEPSTAFRADIGYGIDAVKTILDLKARVEALEAK